MTTIGKPEAISQPHETVEEREARVERERVNEVLLEEHVDRIDRIIAFLQEDKGSSIDAAIEMKKSLPDEVDLVHFEGYEEQVKSAFRERLKKGHIRYAKKIHNELGQGIDFSNEANSCFYEKITNTRINFALKIQKEFGERIDFTEAIKSSFLECLNKGRFASAFEIQNKLGHDIDFTEQIKASFFMFLNKGQRIKKGDVETVLQIHRLFGQEIDFRKFEGYEDAVKSFFRYSLQKDSTLGCARRIQSELGEGIDLNKIIKAGYIECLEKSFVSLAFNIEAVFNQDINFKQLEGYQEAIKAGFRKCLVNGWIEKARGIQNVLGQGIDFTELIKDGFLRLLGHDNLSHAIDLKNKMCDEIDVTEQIKAGFLRCLSEGKPIGDLLGIREQIGKDIDFSKLEGYEEAVKSGFLNSLNRRTVKNAQEIIKKFGKGFDFSFQIKAGFLEAIKEGRVNDALFIESKFGQAIEFSEQIKSGFLESLKKGRIDEVAKIQNLFPFVIENIRGTKEVVDAFIESCQNLYPNFADYLIEGNEHLVEKFKNEFYVKNKEHITSLLLLKFESLVHFAQHHVRQILREKIEEYGLDPHEAEYKEHLRDDQKLELRQLMEDKQAEMKAKIQAIASPDVISAYRDQKEDEAIEFLNAI